MSTSLADKMQQAVGRFQAQDLAGAERLCGEVLRESPQQPDALHLMGMVRLMGGDAGEAIKLIGRALEAIPDNPMIAEHLGLANLAKADYARAESLFRRAIGMGASHGLLHMRLGLALASQGRMSEAETELRQAVERAPDDPDTYLNLGNLLAAQGYGEEALVCFRKSVALRPQHPDARYNLGTLLSNRGRFDEALAVFNDLLKLMPGNAEVLNSLGLVQGQLGRPEEAERSFRQAITAAPELAEAHSNLGDLLRKQSRLDEAVAACERALTVRPGFGDALVNLGNVRIEQGRMDDARVLYEKALRSDPRILEAHRNLGWLHRTQGRMKEAAVNYRRAVELAPGDVASRADLASALRDGGEPDAALRSFREALRLDPGAAYIHYNLAETLKGMGRFDEAIAEYQQAISLKPDYYCALGGLAYLRQQVCDWNGLSVLWDRLRAEAIGRPDSGLSPFALLYMPFSAEEHLACSREWARQNLDRLVASRQALGFNDLQCVRRSRLRIGYLSWDFHQHATAYLMAELFELHDRERFEIFVYSFGPDDGSPLRARIREASEHFTDVAQESFVETAQRIRRDGIDVLVDLKGYTMGSRPQILALRPAPVQVNWLGFPGSLGTSCVDFLIADAFIIPEGAERHYAEKVVRLPDCYQVNDRKREIAAITPSREECGLPSDGFVFCSFNQTAKVLPDVFAAWMRILTATPGSVLWLLESNRWAMDNLRRAAADQGVAGERLIFARPQPLADHLARYRLADLALDTFPYGSHTTASDALWAGCPLVTRAGDTFPSRVAGSLLNNVGLPELVTGSAGAYERLVMDLAASPARLQEFRRRLREGRDSCPLFDTPRFARNLESALQSMFDERAAGK